MPELPEVETVCRGIRPHITGRKIIHLTHSGKDLRKPVPYEDIKAYIADSTIIDVRRRAKYLIVETANGNLLIIHLGMTGNLGIFSPRIEPHLHCHLRFLLSDGMELRYTDVRRFGSIGVVKRGDVVHLEDTFFKTTGPEPFSEEFNSDYLYNLSRNRSIPVKTFIMTNQVVAGVGNIYANESLFMAGIHPKRKANTISQKRYRQLVSSIRKVLEHAIECGGSTISDYVNADQEAGYFQMNFKVYGKTGENCCTCNHDLSKMMIGGRASYYCANCQK